VKSIIFNAKVAQNPTIPVERIKKRRDLQPVSHAHKHTSPKPVKPEINISQKGRGEFTKCCEADRMVPKSPTY